MSPCLRLVLSVVLALLCGLSASPLLAAEYGTIPGKTPAELFPWATFDPEIPTQEEVTGVTPGSRPLRHGEVLRYLEALADASPRASLTSYAQSYERRKLVILAVAVREKGPRNSRRRAKSSRKRWTHSSMKSTRFSKRTRKSSSRTMSSEAANSLSEKSQSPS